VLSRLIPGGGPALTLHPSIDAAALRTLKPSVSIHGAQLRNQLIRKEAAVAA
jgi:hypothetical protein